MIFRGRFIWATLSHQRPSVINGMYANSPRMLLPNWRCDVHLFSENGPLIKFADRGAGGEDQDGDVDAQGEGERDSSEINLQLPLINCWNLKCRVFESFQ